jgi:ATP-binding cassette, subfamily B, bacterial MsbA
MTTKEFFERLYRDGKAYWPVLLAGILAMALTAATEPTVAWLMKWLLDEGFKPSATFNPWWIPVVLISLFLVRGIGTFASSYCMQWIASRMTANLRVKMFDRIMNLPTSEIDNDSTAKYVSLVVFEVGNVTSGVGNVITTVVRDSLIVIGLFGYLLWLNWKLTLIALLILPTVALVVMKFSKRIRRLSGDNITLNSELTRIAEEAVANHKVVKVYGGSKNETGKFAAVSEKLRNFQRRLVVVQSVMAPLTQSLAAIALAAVIMIAVIQARADQTSLGGFVSFVTAMLMVLTPLKHLADINAHLQKAVASADAVYKLIESAPELDTGEQVLGNPRARGEIEFSEVGLQYEGASRQALNGVSFKASPGKTLALVGPSGGGKTSIANLLPRFHAYQSGKILVDGVPIEELTLESLRKNIAIVSQEVMLFNATIAQNIAYGSMEGASKEQVRAAAKAAYLEDYIDSLPEGFDTPIGERGVKLSGGQRQRVAIARAVLKNAPILILDEATSALDTESERYVQQALEGLMKDRTTLVIAHRMSTIQNADEIIVLVQGQVRERGNHASLMAAGGVYAGLYSANAEHNDNKETP